MNAMEQSVTNPAEFSDDGASRVIPKVSIGMPVYNGGAYLEAAIQSILEQTYRDFELIISDNASTDTTGEICERFARMDNRIRYFRQPHNLGAAPNHNFTFHEARGEYFKWSAHDDVMAPTLVERCVEALDRSRDIQLAFPRTHRIDESGALRGDYPEYSGMRLMSHRPSERFGDMVCEQHNCVAFFGLARHSELSTTSLLTAREGSDRQLLADLALRGPLFEIPEYLFYRREHSSAYSNSVPLGERMAWWDTSRAERITFPEWRSLAIYVQLINKAPISRLEKAACRLQLVRWLFGPRWYRQRWVKLLRDLALGGYRYGRRSMAKSA